MDFHQASFPAGGRVSQAGGTDAILQVCAAPQSR
jgi:hypothetical protein